MASTVYRGEDKLITVTVNDSNGSPIDLDTLAGIQCYIYRDAAQTPLAKFSLNSETGFEPLTISDGPNGQYQVRLQSDVTATATPGFYSLETKIERTDANYDNSSKHDVSVDEGLIEMKIAASESDSDLTA